MSMDHRVLEAFSETSVGQKKGALACVLHLTRLARDEGLPQSPESWKAESSGQVRGLGKTSVQAILAEHGIDRVLASEGGRTSRGNMVRMEAYWEFLRGLAPSRSEFEAIEAFWVTQVRLFFQAKPIRLAFDPSKTVQAALSDLVDEVKKREENVPGATYLGTVLQHLVAAKLEIVLGDRVLPRHGASVADAPTERAGDFLIESTVIHATTAPGEALMDKCRENLGAGLMPIIVTLREKVGLASGLAEQGGIQDRVEVFGLEPFLVLNVHEHSRFGAKPVRETLASILERYNEIIDEVETDPGLRIELT